MKIFFVKSFLPICLFLLPILLAAQSKPSCAEFEGIWEYDLPDFRGMWFSQNDRYLWVLVPKERKSFSTENPRPEEKAMAFEELNVSAGVFKCEGQRATATHLYSKNPGMAGQSFQFDFEFKEGKNLQ